MRSLASPSSHSSSSPPFFGSRKHSQHSVRPQLRQAQSTTSAKSSAHSHSTESDPLLPSDRGSVGGSGGIRRRSPAPRAAVGSAFDSVHNGRNSASGLGGSGSAVGSAFSVSSASRMDHRLLHAEHNETIAHAHAHARTHASQDSANDASVANVTTHTVDAANASSAASAATSVASVDPPSSVFRLTDSNSNDARSLCHSSSGNMAPDTTGSIRVRPDGTYQPPTNIPAPTDNSSSNNNNNNNSHVVTVTGTAAPSYKYYDSISDPDQLRQRQQQQQQHQHPNPSQLSQDQQQRYFNASTIAPGDEDDPNLPHIMEIPEDVYAVRKAALQVLKPLTKTWLVVSVGFALTVLFGMARWTRLLQRLPFWFILLPSWMSHVGLFWCHIMSAKALSLFIADANESRQRLDSRDHLDRTEYLPLLQRSLKFGFKTGCVSFGFFLFEILLYFRLIHHNMSLTVAFLPLWVIVVGGILDGIICKTQHIVRVLCWVLVFTAMVLTVVKIDLGYDSIIRWRYIVAPIVCVLAICSATLIYIIYGHQIGFYRLTESQLTAGNLYSLAALLSIVLVVILGEVIPLSRPVEVETRLLVVMLAPMVVVLLGMGAWVVSRDEYGRLLLHGGQAAVHPRKLQWHRQNGWTSVQGNGVTNIPMFGEVDFQPLDKQNKPESKVIEMCTCCGCYPFEESSEPDEIIDYHDASMDNHPYLSPHITQPHLGGNGVPKSTAHINTLPTYNTPAV